MSKVNDLIEKRARTWNAAKEILDGAGDKPLTPEEDHKFNDLCTEIDDLTKQIDNLKKMEDIDRKLNEPTSKPIRNNPVKPKDKTKSFLATNEYKAAALDALRTNFRHVTNVLQEGIDGQGGYLVPDEWDSRLIDVLDEENIMRSLGTIITTSGEHKINIAAGKPAASWTEEGGELSFGDATFEQKLLDAFKLTIAIKVSEELLYDNAFDLESYILDQFGKAIANAEEDSFLNGDGSHKPTGLFHETLGGQRKVTTSGNKISADDIIDLVYTLRRPYRKSASFIMNDTVIRAVRKLKDANGQYLWQPSLTAGEPDTLFGYPLHTSQFAPEGEAGQPVMAFGDYSYYNIGDRGTRSFQELKELFAGNGMIGYVMKQRVDGKLLLPEAVQILTLKASA